MLNVRQDFKDLLHEFNTHRVEFIIVGAHALAAHGLSRATEDFDVWIRPSPTNAKHVLAALKSFGAPVHNLTEKDLSKEGLIFQIGVKPIRIDIITSIDGISFDKAWSKKLKSRLGNERGNVLSYEHLIINKSSTGRPKDLLDVEWLQRNKPRKKKA
jgi:hypothetical protein